MANIYKQIDRTAISKDLDAQRPQQEREVGFAERFGTAREKQYYLGSQMGRNDVYENLVEEDQAKLDEAKISIKLPYTKHKDKSHQRDFNPSGHGIVPNISEFDWDGYHQIVKDNPDLGLRTKQELDGAQLEKFRQLTEAENLAAQDSTFMGSLGGLVGAAVGYVQDPLGASSMLVGGGMGAAGVHAMKTAGQFALYELGIAGVEMAVNKPGEVEVREALGEEVNALEETLTELVLAAGIGGAVGGIAQGVVNKAAKLKLKRMEAKLGMKAEDVLESIDTFKDTDYMLKNKPEGMTYEEHQELLKGAIEKEFAKPSPIAKADTPEEMIEEVVPEVVIPKNTQEVSTLLKELDEVDLTQAGFEDIATLHETHNEVSAFEAMKTCLLGK